MASVLIKDDRGHESPPLFPSFRFFTCNIKLPSPSRKPAMYARFVLDRLPTVLS
jgi:hypothetical protein